MLTAQPVIVASLLIMFKTVLFVLAASLPVVSSLECLFNSTVGNRIYSNGMLIRAYTSNYNLGVLECSEKLTRCVAFKAMDISFFNTLDLAQDKSIFVNLIKGNNGKVAGRACMSESDTTKINAQEAEDCTGIPDTSCFCLTDECTGPSGVQMTLISLIIIVLYSIVY